MWEKIWRSSKYWISCKTNNSISTIDFLNSQLSVRNSHYSLCNRREELSSYHRLVYNKCNSNVKSFKTTEWAAALKDMQEDRFSPSAASVQDCIISQCLSVVQISFVNPILFTNEKCHLEYSSTFLNLWRNNHSKF
jgi:hypothetical protein